MIAEINVCFRSGGSHDRTAGSMRATHPMWLLTQGHHSQQTANFQQSSLSHTRQPDRGLFPFPKNSPQTQASLPQLRLQSLQESLRTFLPSIWQKILLMKQWLSGKDAERRKRTEPSFSYGAAIRKPLLPTAKFKPNSEAVLLLLSWP